MKTDKNFNKMEIYVLSSLKLYEFICGSIKIDIKMKKNGTCLVKISSRAGPKIHI